METLYPDARALALATIQALRTLHGTIPRDLYGAFLRTDVRIPMRAFAPIERVTRRAPAERPPCPGVTKKGTPCKNKACAGHEMCKIHYKQSARMVTELETVLVCTGTTAKGEPCKCPRFRGFEVCWRHAKKAGLMPDIPSDCAICMNEMAPSERTKTKCGHYFHTACLTEWATRRGTVSGSRRRRIGAPCPMCRTPFSLAAPPAPPLEGPDWYVMGNEAPTYQSGAAEWVERLNVIPTNPMMTPEGLLVAAASAGRRMLAVMDEYDGMFPNDLTARAILNMYSLTRR